MLDYRLKRETQGRDKPKRSTFYSFMDKKLQTNEKSVKLQIWTHSYVRAGVGDGVLHKLL